MHEKLDLLELSPQEVTAIIEAFLANDLLTITTSDRPGIPDEAQPVIPLQNAIGDRYGVSNWSGDWNTKFFSIGGGFLKLAEKAATLRPIFDGHYRQDFDPPAHF